ncbi:MAG: hypothetical protein ACMG6E_10045 [Candidatus Roizmanbacteria bacterium]
MDILRNSNAMIYLANTYCLVRLIGLYRILIDDHQGEDVGEEVIGGGEVQRTQEDHQVIELLHLSVRAGEVGAGVDRGALQEFRVIN